MRDDLKVKDALENALKGRAICNAIIEWGDAHCELAAGHGGPHLNYTHGVARDQEAFGVQRVSAEPSIPLSAIRALIQQWREKARRVRPLESAPLTAEKRARIAEWMHYTNRANELEALCPAPSEEPPTR